MSLHFYYGNIYLVWLISILDTTTFTLEMCLIQEKSESITVAAARKINLWTAKAKFIIASCLAKSNLDEIGPGGLSNTVMVIMMRSNMALGSI